jgi:hypothetical protein
MMQLPWFSRDMDNLVHPLVGGRLYTVLAPTGTGKTLVGLNAVARWMEPQHPWRVLVVATEEAARYHELLACWATNTSYADLFYGRLKEAEAKGVQDAAQRYRDHERLWVMPEFQPTLEQIGAAIDAIEPHVIVIDHLHALDDQGGPFLEFLGAAVSAFAEMAGRRQIPVLLLAQVNRPQAKDPLYCYRIPTVNAGLGSSKIEHFSAVMLGLSRKLRDDVPKDVLARLAKGLLKRGEQLRDYEERNTARLTVLKHRMDDDASRRSVLLTVNRGKLQDRLALTGTDNQGDAFEDEAPF